MFENHLWESDILSKDAGVTCIFTENVTPPQVFFKHFASKNQLPGFYISWTLVENGLNIETLHALKSFESVLILYFVKTAFI